MESLPRSSISVAVEVASDREPVTCDGVLTQSKEGFALEFFVGNDKFIITHGVASTRIAAAGDMSYDIELKASDTETVLSTPFGMVRFTVKTLLREVTSSDEGIKIVLKYILASDAAGEIERTVDLAVRFLS